MNIVTQYCCDLCGESYLDKKSCERCEQSHIKPERIEAVRFRAEKYNNPYVDHMLIRMNDGALAKYTFQCIVEQAPDSDKNENEVTEQ